MINANQLDANHAEQVFLTILHSLCAGLSEEFEMFRTGLIVATLMLGLATPALAKPAIGLGVSFSFGGGAPDVGIGLRVLSNNRQNKTVGTVGIDYMMMSQSLRPTIGVAHVGKHNYVGADMGFDLNGGGVSFGLGAGGASNTKP